MLSILLLIISESSFLGAIGFAVMDVSNILSAFFNLEFSSHKSSISFSLSFLFSFAEFSVFCFRWG